MIIAFIGTPGSGKTYEAVKNVLENLMKGRTVYTNIDGLDNEYCREFIKNYLNVGTFFLDTHLIFLTNDEAQEFWLHCKPKSYIAIDECHKLFSNRDWQTSKNREFTFWASTHRHHGYDLLLITQDIVKVDSHVRSLVEWTYVYRKVNFLGSKVNRKYICFAYSGEDAQGPPLKKNIRTYNPDIFRCYQSYASADIKELAIMQHVNILKHPVFYAIPVALIFTLYMFFGKSSFATGDLFGAKKVLSKVENTGKEQPAETIKQQPESKPVIAETAANEKSEEPSDQESEEQDAKKSHHIYRYLDRRTNTAHDTNNVDTIPPGVPYWPLI
jgi:zona occludens toxin (predicted ATPase)